MKPFKIEQIRMVGKQNNPPMYWPTFFRIFSLDPYVLICLQVDLRCNYKLDGENMYSLKWYRDNVEFYR